MGRFFTDSPYFKIVVISLVREIGRFDINYVEVAQIKEIFELILWDLMPMAFIELLWLRWGR
jgi:hypothetical protein